MQQILVIILFVVVSLSAPEAAFAQTSDTARKTQDLVAALDKTKYKKKEKKNFVVEVYVDIKNEPLVKNNVREYAGNYGTSGSDYRIELRVLPDGRAEGSGYDLYFENSDFNRQSRRSFTLRDAKIEGALLTATKVYENGEAKKFEAVFVNRTAIGGKNPNEIESRRTDFGLGFIDVQGNFTNRVFLELKP
jgi:hypothetical protein